MTANLFAIWLFLAGTEAAAPPVEPPPTLTIDPCVGVDEATVRQVVELELYDPAKPDAVLFQTADVRCTDDPQEIRIEIRSSGQRESIRSLRLPTVNDGAGPAGLQARSRELALAVAEGIRRLAAAPPPPPEPPPPVPAPVPPLPTVAVAAPPPQSSVPPAWELGVVATFDYFSGGQNLAGGDLRLARRLGRWCFAELRAGGRRGGDQSLPGGHLTVGAMAASAAAGVGWWPAEWRVAGRFALRAQGYLVQFVPEPSDGADAQTARLGTFVLAAEPGLSLAVTHSFSLQAAVAVGVPLHGVVVRVQGREAGSLSGLAISGNLGGTLEF